MENASTRSDKPQFQLRSLLVFLTALCALLATTSALGTTPWQLLVGLLVIGLICLTVILAVERLRRPGAASKHR